MDHLTKSTKFHDHGPTILAKMRQGQRTEKVHDVFRISTFSRQSSERAKSSRESIESEPERCTPLMSVNHASRPLHMTMRG